AWGQAAGGRGQIEQEKDGRQREHEQRGVEKWLRRHFIVPVKKRAEADIDEAKELRAVERVAPRTLLLLEIAHQPEAVKRQRRRGERGHEPPRFEPVGPGGFGANDQRRGQSPKQGGQAAGEPSERAEQFWIRRGFRHFEEYEG